MGGGIVLVGFHNPELLNHRGQGKKKKDAKPWDRALVPVYGVPAFYVLPVVMGLDVGRYGWSHLGAWAAAVGTLLFAAGSVVLTWAMLVNTHFETVVRIQTDRGHKVVTTGPYGLVRHPGYVGAGLWALGTPLIVGSAYGLIPAALAVITLVVRTALEDRTLGAELPGYADYAARTRHRLLPGIW
jgi:protein-S-isoprenylcysteine O-methyltransferase Ste14